MGENYIQTEEEDVEDVTEVRLQRPKWAIYKLIGSKICPRKSKRYCNPGMSRLGQDKDRCRTRRDPGDGGEAQVDH